MRIMECGLDSSGFGQGEMAGCCEHDIGLSGCIRDRKCLEKLNVLLASQEQLRYMELIFFFL